MQKGQGACKGGSLKRGGGPSTESSGLTSYRQIVLESRHVLA